MANDDEIVLDKIREELDAYISYKDGSRKVKNEHAKKVMEDIADEELVHAGELSEVVEEVNSHASEKVKEGYKEAKNMDESPTDEGIKVENQNENVGDNEQVGDKKASASMADKEKEKVVERVNNGVNPTPGNPVAEAASKVKTSRGLVQRYKDHKLLGKIKNLSNRGTGQIKESASPQIPSFKSMVEAECAARKSGGGLYNHNAFGVAYIGGGKKDNSLTIKPQYANRDDETGKFTTKKLNVEGCTKKEISFKEHDQPKRTLDEKEPEPKIEEAPAKKSVDWMNIIKS